MSKFVLSRSNPMAPIFTSMATGSISTDTRVSNVNNNSQDDALGEEFNSRRVVRQVALSEHIEAAVLIVAKELDSR